MSETAPNPAALFRARAEAEAAALPPLILSRGAIAATAVPGGHGLRRPGTGEDFWQYRPAHEADTARAIDWRRSARGDSHFVRDRERQTARTASLWVGRGAGMGYRGQADTGESKFDRARLIALSLSLSMLRGGERVGLLGERPGSGATQAERLSLAVDLMAMLGSDGDAPETGAVRQGQTVILMDDFLLHDSRLDLFLQRAAGLGVNGVLLQILHPDEEAFPFDGAVRFETAGGLRHETRDADGLRMAYHARLEERRQDLSTMARQAGFQFGTHDLGQPVSQALIWLYGVLSAQ
ncbi:DUF58 domain-containing protein [Paracoccus aerodenitrificans]|uniref:DUF58 domain-containing protein n=1 Tax=Paracoccus aerodenitrificans TaxID=3017781 RepID=UPI0022F08872|nr:DUF58 domain-containing protein [Paracoccus aerodenitrificans]WBU65435.1 DUF58 domain-containing protein [Paracoccus aerodenitrificans]